MKRAVLTLLFVTGIIRGAERSEEELGRLQRGMSSAQTQVAMNEASGALAKYWDGLLEKEEALILTWCDAARAKLFRAAQMSWREYRLAETKLQGDFWRGGSIQPLMHNSTFAAITEQRVKMLQSMADSR